MAIWNFAIINQGLAGESCYGNLGFSGFFGGSNILGDVRLNGNWWENFLPNSRKENWLAILTPFDLIGKAANIIQIPNTSPSMAKKSFQTRLGSQQTRSPAATWLQLILEWSLRDDYLLSKQSVQRKSSESTNRRCRFEDHLRRFCGGSDSAVGSFSLPFWSVNCTELISHVAPTTQPRVLNLWCFDFWFNVDLGPPILLPDPPPIDFWLFLSEADTVKGLILRWPSQTSLRLRLFIPPAAPYSCTNGYPWCHHGKSSVQFKVGLPFGTTSSFESQETSLDSRPQYAQFATLWLKAHPSSH